MSVLTFHLHISPDQFLRYYRGQARNVSVTCDNGQRLTFPAANLRSFLQHDGIHGHFRIEFDHNSKLVSLTKLGR
ncbi:MAG: DUF2835 domain-containing protein [Desulfuromonadaceae bacterium]|nr:DUF2835 domain-containing protein [Desulfuromonadaceae bacterium]